MKSSPYLFVLKWLLIVIGLPYVIILLIFSFSLVGLEMTKARISKEEIFTFLNIPMHVESQIIKENCGSGFDGYLCESIHKIDVGYGHELSNNIKRSLNSNSDGVYYLNLISLKPYPVDLNISWDENIGELTYREQNGQWTASLGCVEVFKHIHFVPKDFIISKRNVEKNMMYYTLSKNDSMLLSQQLRNNHWIKCDEHEWCFSTIIKKSNGESYKLEAIYNAKSRMIHFI